MIWVCREARRPGSSPLARGLLTVADSTGSPARIIPARAGFTATGSRRLPTRPDHPRSRGVYSASISRSLACTGSSPLARGLPRPDWEGGEATRIIPARAGFTGRDNLVQRPAQDHPRSRGVYGFLRAARLAVAGSSPLARGLQLPDRIEAGDPRIIPARAGFTGRWLPPGRLHPDHPRSRGVYTPSGASTCGPSGSSPLARGLPRPFGSRMLTSRIIPARAGFTRRRSQSRSRLLDHPRSRGVYQGSWRRRRSPRGSSPLARGLRTTVRASSSLVRIIPARAGFTVFGVHAHGPLRDHPRSRGVYPKRRSASASRSGSSPLARGLRPPRRENHCPFGIIPARAGFTHKGGRERGRSPDHPRSRGVYVARSARSPSTSGSSPLARGLPRHSGSRRSRARIIPARAGFTHRPGRPGPGDPGSSPLARGLPNAHGTHLRDDGIIPARAGFTPAARRGYPGQRDHPRSRGVYDTQADEIAAVCGSSPLARGLHDDGGPVQRTDGIIPARAGFTSSRRRRRPHRQDHPRSRGVYCPCSTTPVSRPGSSPLARGLRAIRMSGGEGIRIIPARAGFTGPGLAGGVEGVDHPRSRGVYALVQVPTDKGVGSSPLARGLRPLMGLLHHLPGIIPARAGFTTGCGVGMSEASDHPRSRGVYQVQAQPGGQGLGSSPLARGLPSGARCP